MNSTEPGVLGSAEAVQELLLAAYDEARETEAVEDLIALLIGFTAIMVATRGGQGEAEARRWSAALVGAVNMVQELGADPAEMDPSAIFTSPRRRARPH